MAAPKPVTESLPIPISLPTEALEKKGYPFREDVIDNRDDTAPHFKPPKDEEDEFEAPTLPDPSTYTPCNYSKSLTQMLDSVFAVGEVHKDTASAVIDTIQTSISQQYRKSVDNAIEEEQYTEAGGWCDFFRKVAVCILAAFSIVIGGELLQDSPLAALSMIGSGITTLFGNLLIDSNTEPGAASVLTLLSAGFGLIAGMTFNPNAIQDVATQIAMAALAIVSSASEMGRQYTHFQIQEVKAMQAVLQELLTRCQSIIEGQGEHTKKSNEMIVSSLGYASKGASAVEDAKRMIVANMITANAV